MKIQASQSENKQVFQSLVLRASSHDNAVLVLSAFAQGRH